IARPAPGQCTCEQILRVDWNAITMKASPETNYQILPGDRVFVKADRFFAFDTAITKLLRPVEMIMGDTSLGTSTIQKIKFFNRGPGFGAFGGATAPVAPR